MASPLVEPASAAPPARRHSAGSWLHVSGLGRRWPGLAAVALFVGLVALGHRTGWKMSRVSELSGAHPADPAWCAAHSVSDAMCVECLSDVLPRGAEYGWCRVHGVHECPLCHPEVAQLPALPVVTEDELRRTAAALDFAPRAENNSRCQTHRRRIQLASARSLGDIGIAVAEARQHVITETITTSGEIGFAPTQVARVSPRAGGLLWRVEKRIGDKVRAGELLALVDAAEAGQAKAAFQQALTQFELKTQSLARRKPLEGQTIAGRIVLEAEADALEAQVQMLATHQALINLGLPSRISDFAPADPAANALRLQFLGLSRDEQSALEAQTPSNNLLPVRSPLDGEVVQCDHVPGEAVDTDTLLFVIADPRTMWLTLNVALEHAEQVQVGQPVRFRHEGHADEDEGVVSFVGRAVDEATRTVPVIVELPNPDGGHVAGTYGKASVVLRREPRAVVVPSSAVHWEGDCHVVFVRDRNFGRADAPQVFHVRKVRPGVQDVAVGTPVTEVIAGLLPGEMVATTNSGIFRAELLKNHLGAG